MAVAESATATPVTKERLGREPDGVGGSAKAEGRHRQLREAEPEDVPLHLPEMGQLELEPDDEQEEHHSEFGHGRNGLRILHQAEARRSDGDACSEVAEDGAQAEKPEHGHRHDRRRAEGQDGWEETDVGSRGCHEIG